MKIAQRIWVVLTTVILSAIVSANSAPQVSNVRASQRNDDSKLVDIYYNLYDAEGDACTVWVAISDNGGQTWSVPAMTFTGAIGKNISPGNNKLIVWDAGKDMPGKIATFKARVYADDGKGPIEMLPVPAGWFAYNNAPIGNYVFVNSFLIAKYETTNQLYCQFLNDADPTSQHWDSQMSGEIQRTGGAGNYSYTVVSGRENYPVRWVNYYDAEAFCAWLSAKTGQNYRLPDQYKWQKAAGWDPVQNKLWTYGFQSNSIDCSRCNYNYCKGGPMPVGFYNGINSGTVNSPSYYGCYDMSGNVWEWTTEVSGSYRVLRGGNWNGTASNCAVTYAGISTPTDRSSGIGFRLVLDLN